MPQKYNFAIIPSEAVCDRAVEMSEWISAEGTEFVLDGESLHPHISLYHVSLDPDRLPLVITTVSAGLESIRPFFLRQGPYRAVEDEWIDVSYDRDEQISLGLDRGIRAVRAAPHVFPTEKEGYCHFLETAIRSFGFYVDRIGLFEMGEHGTCTRLVHEFTLKS